MTPALAKKPSQRFGNAYERLQARLELEAKREPTPIAPDDNLLTLREAAARLHISPWTVRDWALKDKLIYRRIGGLLLMIPESEVERLLSYGN